jgi:hypothetical protein
LFVSSLYADPCQSPLRSLDSHRSCLPQPNQATSSPIAKDEMFYTLKLDDDHHRICDLLT